MFSDDDKLTYGNFDDDHVPDDDEDILDRDAEDDDEDVIGSRLGSSRPPNRGTSPFSPTRSSSSGTSPFSSQSGGRSAYSRVGGGPIGRRASDDDDEDGDEDSLSSGGSGVRRTPSFSSPQSPGGNNPFSRTSGGSPPRSQSGMTFGSRSPSARDDEDEDDEDERDRKPTDRSRSAFGGTRPPAGTSPFGANRPGTSSGGTSSFKGSGSGRSGLSKGKEDEPPSRSSTLSSRSSAGSPSTRSTFNRQGSGGGDAEDDRRSPTSGARRPAGGGTSGGRSSGLPGPSSGGAAGAARRPPSPTSRTSGSAKPDSKADDEDKADGDGKKPAARSGLAARNPFNWGAKPADKGEADAKDKAGGKGDDAGDGASRDRLSDLRSRFSGGFNKAAQSDGDGEKTDDDGAKSAGATAALTGALGSVRGRIPFGRKPKGEDDSTDSGEDSGKKAGGAASPPPTTRGGTGAPKPASSSSSAFSNTRGNSAFSGRSTAKPASGSSSDDAPKPSRPPFGASGGKGIRGGAKPAAKTDTQAAEEAPASESGGFGARMAAMASSLPFIGGGEDEKPVSRTVRQSKAPQVKQNDTWLTLDRKLDILGVGLVLSALALMLSSLSPTQGVLTESINNFFASLLGWGALAVPIAMFAIGMWLIIRHFGDEAPTVDIERLIGIAILYVGLLSLFQFIHALNYENMFSFELLQLETSRTWLDTDVIPAGGGWVGGNLYLLGVQYLGEILSFAITIFVIIVGIMFVLDMSVSEIAIIIIGLYRSYTAARRRSSERKKVRRAERLAKRQEQVAALSAPPSELPTVSIAKPKAEPLAAGTVNPALPESTDQQRSIPITMGGKTVNAPLSGAEAAAASSQAELPSLPAAAEQSAGGGGNLLAKMRAVSAFAALRGGDKPKREQPTAQQPAATPPPAAPPPSQPTPPAAEAVPPAADNTSSGGLGGIMGRLPFGGGKSTSAEAAKPDAEASEAAASTPLADAKPPAAGQPTLSSVADLEAPPSAAPVSPPPAAAKATPFEAPLGKPAPTPTAQDDQAKSRLAQALTAAAAGAASGAAQSTEPAASTPSENGHPTPNAGTTAGAAPTTGNGMSRAERLNAIRQGRGGQVLHQQQASEPPTNGTPPANHAASPPPQAQSSPAPSVDPSRTDAYGNAPTPPAANFGRPDEMKPPPANANPIPIKSAAPAAPTGKRSWSLPDIGELLNEGSEQDFDRQFLVEQARVIEDTLRSFGAPGRVVEINTGPVITQYGVEPDYLESRSGKKSRVKVSAIAQLDRDLQLALGAKSIRIEAPVPGKGYVGIEIPNAENALVSLKDVMESNQFKKVLSKSPLAISLGQSVDGTPIAADLAAMPHMLIAGTTGSGKSVCVNAIISSLLTNNTPEQLKFIMVDPKRVELTGYNGIPHLVAPVVVELERIVGVLKWVTREMDERYKRFSGAGARNIVDFNDHLAPDDEQMPYIVVIIDELADLMMLAPEETERTITRIAALARATGIHLVIATQRPSVDVVTGLIKANFPARVAFAVAGGVDSRVILDQPGAERLLGRGDMLYLSGNSPAPLRLQGVFVSDEEIDNITRFWKTQGSSPSPSKKMAPMTLDPVSAPRQMTPSGVSGVAPSPFASSSPAQKAFWDNANNPTVPTHGAGDDEPDDEMYEEAVELVRKLNKASVSLLQRRLRIGYTRASRLIDIMEERGVIGSQESGSKPREVLPD